MVSTCSHFTELASRRLFVESGSNSGYFGLRVKGIVHFCFLPTQIGDSREVVEESRFPVLQLN